MSRTSDSTSSRTASSGSPCLIRRSASVAASVIAGNPYIPPVPLSWWIVSPSRVHARRPPRLVGDGVPVPDAVLAGGDGQRPPFVGGRQLAIEFLDRPGADEDLRLHPLGAL